MHRIITDFFFPSFNFRRIWMLTAKLGFDDILVQIYGGGSSTQNVYSIHLPTRQHTKKKKKKREEDTKKSFKDRMTNKNPGNQNKCVSLAVFISILFLSAHLWVARVKQRVSGQLHWPIAIKKTFLCVFKRSHSPFYLFVTFINTHISCPMLFDFGIFFSSLFYFIIFYFFLLRSC